MRRGSLIGPLLILLAGIVLFMYTLRPEMPLLELAARYWPFLLLAWGLLRLIEILIWAARSRPLPRSGISVGEWVAIIFICLIGSGLYTVNRFRPWQHLGIISEKRIQVFGRAYDYPLPEQKKTVGKAPRILIENLNGNVRITGAAAQEVVVSGRKSIRALQESDAGKANKQSELELSTEGGQVVVRTNQDRVTGDQEIATHLELTVPRDASIEARGREGDFDITGISGEVNINSNNAGVRLEDIGGNVHLDVRRSDRLRVANVKGGVEIIAGRGRDLELEDIGGETTVTGMFSGDLEFRNLAKPLGFHDPRTDLRVEKVAGQIQMDLRDFSGTNLAGPIRLSTRSRDVQIDDFTAPMDILVDRGDISLRPGRTQLARINAVTRSGNVVLTLPESSNFQLKATTNAGEVQNEFGPVLRQESLNDGGSLLGGTAKGAEVVLLTSRGSITVRKDSGAPLAPKEKEQRRPGPRRRGATLELGSHGIHVQKF